MAVHLETLGAEFLVKGFQKFFGTMKKADSAIDDLGDTGQKTSGVLSGALSVALGQGLVVAAQAAFGALMKVGGALIGLGAESLTMAVDFQSSLTTLELAAASTGLTFDELHDTAIAIGGDTRLLGVSATGAAEAMEGLFKAGLTEIQVMGDLNGYLEDGAELSGALRASIDLAAASELDMVQAAELASVVISSFGQDAEKAGMSVEDWIVTAMDSLVGTADASVASVEGLQEALVNVGPAAAGAGFDLNDINTSLAVLSMAGIQGGAAGTKLNSMINSLRDLTPGASAALKQLGIEVRDSSGVMLDMQSIVLNFEQGLEGMTAAEKDAALGAVLTSQGLQVMDTFLKTGADGFEGMAMSIEGATSMMEIAAKKSQTYAGQMEAFEGVMETLKIQIGEALLPVATKLLEFIAELVEKYGPQFVAVFETIGDVLLGLTEGFLAFMAGAPGDFPWEDIFPPWLSEVMYTISAIFENLMLSFSEGGTILDALGIMFGEWLPANIQLASDFFTGVILPALMAVWAFILEFVIPMLATMVVWLSENLPIAIQAVSDFFNTVLLPTLNIIWAFIQDNVIPILILAAEVMSVIVGTAIEVLAALWENVLYPRLQLIWQFIETAVIPILEAVAKVMTAVLGVAIEVLAGFWENVLLPALKEVRDYFNDSVKPILEKAADVWFPAVQKAIDNLIGPISKVVSWLGELATKIANIKIPDWLKGHSPPPLAFWFQDIGNAMKEVTGRTVKMGVEFDKLPAINAASRMIAQSDFGYVRPVAASTVNNAPVSNTSTYDQSRTIHQNFVITPQVLLETVGAVSV